MRKQIKAIIISLLLCFVLAPAVKTEAADNNVKRDFQIKEDISDNSISINQFGEGSSYQGGAVTNLMQTGITANSVTLSWTAASGALGYYIFEFDQNDNYTILGKTETPTAILSYPNGVCGRKIGIVPYDMNNLSIYYYKIYVSTIPAKITGLKINGIFAGTGGYSRLGVIWNDTLCHGFEAYCYNRKGKEVQCVETTLYRNANFTKTNAQNIYSVKVKPYVIINGTQKVYGEFSNTLYAVPQPKSLSKKSDVKQHSFKLKWKKVSGATKYDIYMSTKKNSGYKKVASVKGNKNSCTITKFKGRTLDTTSKKYVKIVTYGKFGKKTVKSQSKPQITIKTTIYWR